MSNKPAQPTAEQIKKFWERCGFKRTRLSSGNLGWLYPPEYSLELGYLPVIDLNNLFKYAVPKLATLDIVGLYPPRGDNDQWLCILTSDGLDKDTLSSDETPALALFWAMWQVMNNKGGA